MRIRSTAFSIAALAIATIALPGCTDRLTTQEAYVTCEEVLGRPAIAAEDTEDGEGDAVFAECVACHENCGPDCALLGTATPSFACPDDQGGGGAGGGG